MYFKQQKNKTASISHSCNQSLGPTSQCSEREMSSSPCSSALHPAEIQSPEYPRLFSGAGDSPVFAANPVTQTVCQCMCVCVCPSWVERSCESVCQPAIHTHMPTHTHSTHSSPEEGNLSAVSWCNFLYLDRSMHSLSTLNVSTCRRCINSNNRRAGTSSKCFPPCENYTWNYTAHPLSNPQCWKPLLCCFSALFTHF